MKYHPQVIISELKENYRTFSVQKTVKYNKICKISNFKS